MYVVSQDAYPTAHRHGVLGAGDDTYRKGTIATLVLTRVRRGRDEED